jgi:hypothetical protein
VTKDHLVHYWSRAGRRDLRQWADEALIFTARNE